MKKVIAILAIILVLIMVLASCKKNETNEETKSDAMTSSDHTPVSEKLQHGEYVGSDNQSQRTPNLEPMEP